jgi:hypothetical protein
MAFKFVSLYKRMPIVQIDAKSQVFEVPTGTGWSTSSGAAFKLHSAQLISSVGEVVANVDSACCT